MKAFLRKAVEAVLGLLIIAAIGYFALSFLRGVGERRAEEKAMAPDLTLAGYADLSQKYRVRRIAAAAAEVGGADRVADFTACMGELAATKNPELPFDDVFGWCELERTTAPATFAGHFDELAAPDLSITALGVCQTMVRNRLKSPSSADFTFVDPVARGRQRYLVSSHVDAQNGFGAMIRARYVCEVQYDGVGDPLQLASWQTHRLVVE